MTIYQVWENDYDYRGVWAAFTTKEEADKCCAYLTGLKDPYGPSFCVESQDVNTSADLMISTDKEARAKQDKENAERKRQHDEFLKKYSQPEPYGWEFGGGVICIEELISIPYSDEVKAH